MKWPEKRPEPGCEFPMCERPAKATVLVPRGHLFTCYPHAITLRVWVLHPERP